MNGPAAQRLGLVQKAKQQLFGPDGPLDEALIRPPDHSQKKCSLEPVQRPVLQGWSKRWIIGCENSPHSQVVKSRNLEPILLNNDLQDARKESSSDGPERESASLDLPPADLERKPSLVERMKPKVEHLVCQGFGEGIFKLKTIKHAQKY